KAKKALQIKYERKNMPISNKDSDIIMLNADATQAELDQATNAIVEIARGTGKIKNLSVLERNVKYNLTRTGNILKKIQLTEYQKWKLDGMRLDLYLGASGSVWFISKLGVKVRVRLEFKVNRKLASNKNMMVNTSQNR